MGRCERLNVGFLDYISVISDRLNIIVTLDKMYLRMPFLNIREK